MFFIYGYDGIEKHMVGGTYLQVYIPEDIF